MGAGSGVKFNPTIFFHRSGFQSTRLEPNPLPSLAIWSQHLAPTVGVKPENNPNNATTMNQPTPASRRRSYPKLPPKTIHPSTQVLSTIPEGLEHPAFGDIPEVQLHQLANNMSTTAPGSSQNGGGTSSTQTNGGALHQSPMQTPSPA
jgi:hypothetical protein